jgi:hypothetical protein
LAARIIDLTKAFQSRIKDFFDAPLDAAATPLEIVHAILDELERKVQPIGRGRRVFPYNRVVVRVGPTSVDRPALQVALDALGPRLRERLAELQAEAPSVIDVKVSLLKRPPAEWHHGQVFAVDCATEAEPVVAPAPHEAPPRWRVSVRVIKGAATEEVYRFAQPVIVFGRTAEPTDERGRVRRNDVVFQDAVDGVTETVGRAHARLQLDAEAGEYRLFNEASSNPTFIVRSGATLQIPPRDPRGVRVRSDDEIHLGRAVVQVTIDREVDNGSHVSATLPVRSEDRDDAAVSALTDPHIPPTT